MSSDGSVLHPSKSGDVFVDARDIEGEHRCMPRGVDGIFEVIFVGVVASGDFDFFEPESG